MSLNARAKVENFIFSSQGTMDSGRDLDNDIVRAIRLLTVAITASIFLMTSFLLWAGGLTSFWSKSSSVEQITAAKPRVSHPEFWRPPDMHLVSDKRAVEGINYGRELIMHTSQYLGP